MDSETRIRLGAFNCVFVAMALWEVFFPRRPLALGRSWRWPNNIGVAVLNAMLQRVLLPAAAVAVAGVAELEHWGFFNNLPPSFHAWLPRVRDSVIVAPEGASMSAYLYEVLERLVAFDTVSSKSDAPAMEFLAERLGAHGFNVDLHRIDVAGTPQLNLVAWAGPARPDGLTISGHLDTVPYAGQPGWNRDPLKLGVDDERVWGRGTTDMKGFLAECVTAAAALDIRALKRPLVFIFTSNEEVGCLGAESVCGALGSILGKLPAPRLVWIGEPTSWKVQHAHKSIVLFDVTVRGLGGHSGAPEQGVNAIAVAARALEAIGHLQAERRTPSDKFMRIFPDAPYDVLNVGTIAGGIAANIIAEQCRFTLTYRSLPDAEPLEIYREIQRRLAALDLHDYASHNHRAAVEVGSPMVVPPLLAPRDTELERALLEVTGTREVGGALFATDGGWFARAGMVPLICGPGDFEQAHKPNENIGRAALESGTEKILKVIARLVQ